MGQIPIIETPHLILRRWSKSDHAPFAAINADPEVMQFFPSVLTTAESDAVLDRIEWHFKKYGYGLYAAELRSSRSLAGFIGLNVPSFHSHFTPCVEIGWRLASRYWGQGLATEGATAVLQHARGVLRLSEVVSFTVPANIRSRRVMEKLQMTHDSAEDFDHPQLPPGHPLRRHVLYRANFTS